MRPHRPLLALLLLAAGCDAPSVEAVASSTSPILGGVVSNASDDAVVKIEATQSMAMHTCSGALIAPNLVLTARHCVADYVDLAFTCNSEGDLTSGPGGYMGAVVSPDKVVIKVGTQPPNRVVSARGAQIFSLASTTICRNDIALVLLDRSLLDLPVLPIRLDRGTQVGEVVRVVGYGISDDADAGLSTRHTRSGMVITKVGTSQYRPNGDPIPPRSFQLDGGGLCIGDSGGPALGESGAIVGLDSKFTGPCTSSSTVTYYTETGPFSDELIRPAFAAAGFEPLLETPSTGGLGGGAGAPSNEGGSAGTTVGGSGAGGDSVGRGGSGTYTEAGSGGQGSITSHSSSSMADGGEDLIYEGAPPKGGGCDCRQASGPSPGFGWFVAALAALLARRRKVMVPLPIPVRVCDNRRRR